MHSTPSIETRCSVQSWISPLLSILWFTHATLPPLSFFGKEESLSQLRAFSRGILWGHFFLSCDLRANSTTLFGTQYHVFGWRYTWRWDWNFTTGPKCYSSLEEVGLCLNSRKLEVICSDRGVYDCFISSLPNSLHSDLSSAFLFGSPFGMLIQSLQPCVLRLLVSVLLVRGLSLSLHMIPSLFICYL